MLAQKVQFHSLTHFEIPVVSERRQWLDLNELQRNLGNTFHCIVMLSRDRRKKVRRAVRISEYRGGNFWCDKEAGIFRVLEETKQEVLPDFQCRFGWLELLSPDCKPILVCTSYLWSDAARHANATVWLPRVGFPSNSAFCYSGVQQERGK